MTLKSEYNNLPFSVQQKVSYEEIRRYVFFGSVFPKKLQQIIRNKLVGRDQVLPIKELREVAKKYGCGNEFELSEQFALLNSFKKKIIPALPTSFHKLKWQKQELN